MDSVDKVCWWLGPYVACKLWLLLHVYTALQSYGCQRIMLSETSRCCESGLAPGPPGLHRPWCLTSCTSADAIKRCGGLAVVEAWCSSQQRSQRLGRGLKAVLQDTSPAGGLELPPVAHLLLPMCAETTPL